MDLLRAKHALTAVALVASAWGRPAAAQVATRDQALALAFAGASIERRTAFLDEASVRSVVELAGPDVDPPGSVITYYVATRDGAPTGVAYFDAHRVRTLDEVLMIVIDLQGRVQRVETVTFREPPEYEAPAGWLAQFRGRRLDEDLSLRGSIATMTGATLTANAATRAVRRALALHRVVDPFGREAR